MDALQIDNAVPVDLSPEDQQQVARYIKETWEQGKKDREEYERDWKKCIQAYDCEYDMVKDPRLAWRSTVYLPWVYDAIEAWLAYLSEMLFPKDESFFDFNARAYPDHPGAEVAEKYLRHTFNVNGLTEWFDNFLRQAGITGSSVLKIYWKEERQRVINWQDRPVIDPISGLPFVDSNTGGVFLQKVPMRDEISKLNNAWVEVVPMDQFVFYPLEGDFAKTTRIHQTWKQMEELEDLVDQGIAPYFNLDKVRNNLTGLNNDALPSTASSSSPYYAQTPEMWTKGVELREAYIHRVKIGDTVYRNYIATLAGDDILIRFQPNTGEMGADPFIFFTLIPKLNKLIGTGLCTKSIGPLKVANFLTNARLNELKLKIYGNYKYVDDSVFNPYNFIARPGGLTKVGRLDNLVPIDSSMGQGAQITPDEVANLKSEFEETTVPKIVKGIIDEGMAQATATQSVYTNTGASGRMNRHAKRINDNVIKPMIEKVYLQIYQRMQYDPRIIEDIARVTQTPIVEIRQLPNGQPLPKPITVQLPIQSLVGQLPKFLPLPEIDIQIVGYQNQTMRQQMLVNLNTFTNNAARSPWAMYLKGYNIFKLGARLMMLPVDEILCTEQEKDQIDANQAKAAQTQQAAGQQGTQLAIAGKLMEMQQQNQEMQLQASEHQAQQQTDMINAANDAAKNQIAAENLNLQTLQTLHQMKMAELAARQNGKRLNAA